MTPPQFIIDCATAGIGDTVTCAWIAEGARALGIDCRLRAGRNADVARLFNQPIEPVLGPGQKEPRRMALVGGASTIYRRQLDEGGGVGPITHTWQEWGFDWPDRPNVPRVIEPRRPEAVIDERDLAWARGEIRSHGDRQVALMFPMAAWGPRAWPMAYYLDLAWQMQAAGWTVFGLDQHRNQVDRFPYWYAGLSWERIAALIRLSTLVVCNESGAAHVAATIGTPTMVLCGPTRPEANLSYLPQAMWLRAERTESLYCVGCHFKREVGGRPAFRAACDSQCRALMELTPESVYAEIDLWDSTRLPTGTPTPEAEQRWRSFWPMCSGHSQPTATGPESVLLTVGAASPR